jgi:hypothetical protein
MCRDLVIRSMIRKRRPNDGGEPWRDRFGCFVSISRPDESFGHDIRRGNLGREES